MIGAASDDERRFIPPQFEKDEARRDLTLYRPLTVGGFQFSQLTERELPPHSHEFRGGRVMVPGPFRPERDDQIQTPWSVQQGDATGTVLPKGDGQAFSNTQPFLAVVFCMKL
jgi:microcystin-dependent protein